ncbi:MAG: hypothetical protein K2J20_04035 [Bacilli bacterium]|nr:hypothetical protein [Bacilli bacterium]
MRKYIEIYIKELETKIANKHKFSAAELTDIKLKITYFQHERLIHLLVTLFYVLFVFFFLAMGMISFIFLIPFGLGLIFLIFYIRHYFFLENSIQYLYKLLDSITR